MKEPDAGTKDRGRMRSVHLVLPAYDEAETLPSLLGRLQALEPVGDHRLVVWVVDDGSTDGTAEVAQRPHGDLDVRLVPHGENRGLGPAVQTGLRSAVSVAGDEDVVVVMDADDTHDVTLIAPMLAEMAGGSDVVIASRFVPGGDDRSAPVFRRLLSRAAAWIFRRVLPVDRRVRDFTSSYRAYRVTLLRRALEHWGERLIEEQGFACMVELLLKLRHFRPEVREVPMVLRYDRKRGASKLRLVRTLLQYLKLALRDLLSPAPRTP